MAARGEPIEKHVMGGRLRTGRKAGKSTVTAEWVPHHECLNVSWVLLNQGIIAINGIVSKRMSQTIIEGLCAKRG